MVPLPLRFLLICKTASLGEKKRRISQNWKFVSLNIQIPNRPPRLRRALDQSPIDCCCVMSRPDLSDHRRQVNITRRSSVPFFLSATTRSSFKWELLFFFCWRFIPMIQFNLFHLSKNFQISYFITLILKSYSYGWSLSFKSCTAQLHVVVQKTPEYCFNDFLCFIFYIFMLVAECATKGEIIN